MSKKMFIILTVLSIIFLSIGGTFAYYTTTATLTNITQIGAGNLTMTIDGGGDGNTYFMPAKCTSEYAIKKTIVASSVNTSGGKVSFSIGMNIDALSDSFKRNTMRYVLTTNSSSCTQDIVASGSFKDKTVGSDVWLIKNDYDDITQTDSTYTKTYYLYIWLDETETQNLSGSISVNMMGTSSNDPNLPIDYGYDDGNGTNTLFYQIKSNADKYTRIDFSKQSSADNTNGIYTTTNTENNIPVYYYRGAVDNNHVMFANFCWRIIRTTETGGVKLIYDGVPSNGECNNTGSDTTIGSFPFNTSANSPAYAGYMYNTVYTYSSKDMTTQSGSIVFGNDITYNSSTNTYTLSDTYTLTDTSNWASEYSTVASKYHYTCLSSGTSCQSMHYIYASGNKYAYYFTLTNGKKPIDLLNEMLDWNVNVKDSNAKTVIDSWYKTNMTSYTSQLEDTVFCNDRSYYNLNTSGWNKDYSNAGYYLKFGASQRANNNKNKPILMCPRQIDSFTVNTSYGNGSLTYPAGLLTIDEKVYAGDDFWGGNVSYYLYNNVENTLYASPYAFWHIGTMAFPYSNSSGYYSFTTITSNNYIRPVVSLKSGTVLSSGSGTTTDPYIVG